MERTSATPRARVTRTRAENSGGSIGVQTARAIGAFRGRGSSLWGCPVIQKTFAAGLADVEAGAITVEGEVKGNLQAGERIELKQSARYEGDLRASKLVVDEGAVFNGHVTVGPDVRDCVLWAEGEPLTVLGARDLVVVHANGRLLVTGPGRAEQLKALVQRS